MCAIELEEREVHLGPGVAVADQLAVVGRCARAGAARPSRQASPSSSGVTANGENAVAGLHWKKPKLLASSSGTRLRSVTSFASITQPHVTARRRRRVVPMRRVAEDDADLGLEVEAPRRDRAARCRRAARAARPSRPGRRADRSRSVFGGSAPRALRTRITWLRNAEPSTHSYARGSGACEPRGIERLRRRCRAAVERAGERAQLRLGARPSRRAPPAASARWRRRSARSARRRGCTTTSVPSRPPALEASRASCALLYHAATCEPTDDALERAHVLVVERASSLRVDVEHGDEPPAAVDAPVRPPPSASASRRRCARGTSRRRRRRRCAARPRRCRRRPCRRRSRGSRASPDRVRRAAASAPTTR